MSLAIGKLANVCRLRTRGGTAQARDFAAALDRLARERLPEEIASTLGPALDRQPAVVRIRQLNVRLTLPRGKLKADLIARMWAEAFAQALFHALAYPDGTSSHPIRRFDSEAAYVAACLRAVLRGESSRWEFRELLGDATPDLAAAFAIATRSGRARLEQVLRVLEGSGSLTLLLSALDDVTLEQTIRWEAERHGAPEPLTWEGLTEAVQLMLTIEPVRRWRLNDARQVLRLWVLSAAARTPLFENPRQLLYAMRAVSLLLEHRAWHAPLEEPLQRMFFSSEFHELPESARAVLASLHAASPATLQTLTPLLRRVAEAAGLDTREEITARTQTLRSDWMALLLLTGTVLRLRWWEKLRLPDEQFQCLLFAIACTVMQRPIEDQHTADPAAELFAGITGNVDRRAVTAFLASASPHVCESIGIGETQWAVALQACADQVLRTFLEQVRGFRKASLPFVRDRILHLPGSVLITDRELQVSLDPSPWSPALHLSGIDEAVDAPWLAPRKLTFRLEGL